MDDQLLLGLADRLRHVDGVAAVALGGSRARGTHRPDSDVDIGLYYRGRLDVPALRRLAEEVTGVATDVTEPGGWGPWVDGGGWLTVDSWRVDWILRDLDRVTRIVGDCSAGRYEIGFQPGHPLGFYSHAYAGEVALGRTLADPDGVLAALKEQLAEYPAALRTALVEGLWEAGFSLSGARYGVAGADPAYAAGCLFRAVGVMCHAVHAAAGAWLINEKGMVAAAGRLPTAPADFARRAQAILARVGGTPQEMARTVDECADLLDAVRAGCVSVR
ncbi:nucleotidyltransferase domain-containing protein [Hamadaea tsunoensis]|uniref:nucleotidyltransferase domain-containing protein n=1 Tax=Hamadaea tsunoensis TaxID=53368 RepID=UPI000402482B|nr:nucleotidyltransferase domain-containing protein [Hamadaea tsunoensis]